jgi:hypothetical protein
MKHALLAAFAGLAFAFVGGPVQDARDGRPERAALRMTTDARAPRAEAPQARRRQGAQSRVQVGYCTPLKNLEAAKAAGFDYVELSTTEIAGLSDSDF